MALGKADLKSAIRFQRPNRPERIRPSPDQGRLTAFLKHRASRKQRGDDNNQSQRDLFVHGVDAVRIIVRFQERIVALLY